MSGLAFVVVVHLSPEHKSHLAELLQQHTTMLVQQVNSTVKLEPDSVYVIPPNSNHHRHASAPVGSRGGATGTCADRPFLSNLAPTHDGQFLFKLLNRGILFVVIEKSSSS